MPRRRQSIVQRGTGGPRLPVLRNDAIGFSYRFNNNHITIDETFSV